MRIVTILETSFMLYHYSKGGQNLDFRSFATLCTHLRKHDKVT